MNKVQKIILSIFIILICIVIGIFIFYKVMISKVSNDSSTITFNIEYGTTSNEVIKSLKDSDLIRDINVTKVYMKLHNITNIQAGTYELSKNMDLETILNTLSTGKVLDDEITVTFVEGKRLPYYVSKISESFSYSEEEINSLLTDKDFLQYLIDNYWFITDEILNEDIYYPLEGYFFPDTYRFSKDATIKDIILTLVNGLNDKITPYKEEIESSGYTVHEILTLASIVELEGVDDSSRSGVASVFYNRLNAGWSLGSDATTYYAEQLDFSVALSQEALDRCNAYNTRGSCVTALPVGPICSSGLSSIVSAIEPMESDYYYFVADKYKNTYFTKTYSEHCAKISELQAADLWLH